MIEECTGCVHSFCFRRVEEIRCFEIWCGVGEEKIKKYHKVLIVKKKVYLCRLFEVKCFVRWK